jgi:hypothetical protein
MKMLTSFKSIFILTVVSTTLACNGVPSAMTTSPQNAPVVISRISASDWQLLLSGDRTAQRRVAWRVKITDVSYFGGFYIKGHLLESRNARVHLIWAPETTPSGAARDNLAEGGIVTVFGNLEGVTAEREAIISVKDCMH